jgi:hypothetical protein
MTKHSILAGGAVLAVALIPGGAEAKKPKPSRYCAPKTVGFHARGVFLSGNMVQSQGADTATRRDDRYNGEFFVDVKRANHGAPKGEQQYLFEDARVKFKPKSDTSPDAGDRVHVYGKLTKIRGKRCENTSTTVSKVRRLRIKAKR